MAHLDGRAIKVARVVVNDLNYSHFTRSVQLYI